MPQLSYLEHDRNIFASDAHILQIIKSQEGYIKQPRGDMGGDPSVECETLSAESLSDGRKKLSL